MIEQDDTLKPRDEFSDPRLTKKYADNPFLSSKDPLVREIAEKMDHYFATVTDEQFAKDLDDIGWKEHADMEDKITRSFKDDPDYKEWVKTETEKYIQDADKLSEAVNHSFPNCTVGDIRKAIENLPDDAPVFYQRIEDTYFNDHNWDTYRFPWEYPKEYSKYILAFSAYDQETADGRKVLVINAHY